MAMTNIFPKKLKVGDEIRVIAPSQSLKIISEEQNPIAIKSLSSLGLKLTFAKNVYDMDYLDCGSIIHRLQDLHEAFEDKNVKAIITVIGGLNANQLLSGIDFDLIKKILNFLLDTLTSRFYLMQ